MTSGVPATPEQMARINAAVTRGLARATAPHREHRWRGPIRERIQEAQYRLARWYLWEMAKAVGRAIIRRPDPARPADSHYWAWRRSWMWYRTVEGQLRYIEDRLDAWGA